MGMIRDIEEVLTDVLFDGLDERVRIAEVIKLDDLDVLFAACCNSYLPDEVLLKFMKEKTEKGGAEALRYFLHNIIDFRDDNELIDSLQNDEIKNLVKAVLVQTTDLAPGTLVTRGFRPDVESVVYRVVSGCICKSIADNATIQIYNPAWSGPCPPNYDKLQRWALIRVGGDWYQVHGELKRRNGRFALTVKNVENLHRSNNTQLLHDPEVTEVIPRERLINYRLKVEREDKGGTK
jgi:hypothetical protein